MERIGIIGCGNMGAAICERIRSAYELFAFDKDKIKADKLSGISVSADIIDLVKNSDVIILAVKPQDFDSLLEEIKDSVVDKLIISIAAGIPTDYIEKRLGDVRVIRVMPNMPAKIGKGMSCLCKGRFAKDDDLRFAKELFDKLGKSLIINEDMIDAATAISGSGPGYYFDMIESNPGKSLEEFINSLGKAAQTIGFSREDAQVLASMTGSGSQALIEETKVSPSELKKQITSKGGTTEAALKILHQGGSLGEAVKSALKRAKELSRR